MSFLFLDTRQALNPTITPSDSVFLINQSTQSVYSYKVSFESFFCPNSVYVVNSYNKTISFYENGDTGTLYTFSLSEATYNGFELAIELQTKMNNVVGIANTYSVLFNPLTNKITIFTTLPDTFALVLNISNSAFEVIGFDEDTTDFLTSHTGTSPVRLDGSLYVDVIANFGRNNFNSNGTSNTLARIPLNVPYGSVVYWENQNDSDFIVVDATKLQTIEIILRDDKGNLWELSVSSHCAYTFRISPV